MVNAGTGELGRSAALVAAPADVAAPRDEVELVEPFEPDEPFEPGDVGAGAGSSSPEMGGRRSAERVGGTVSWPTGAGAAAALVGAGSDVAVARSVADDAARLLPLSSGAQSMLSPRTITHTQLPPLAARAAPTAVQRRSVSFCVEAVVVCQVARASAADLGPRSTSWSTSAPSR